MQAQFETFPAPHLNQLEEFADDHIFRRSATGGGMYATTDPLFSEDPGLIKIDSERRPLMTLQAYEEDHSQSSHYEQINYPPMFMPMGVKNEQAT